MDTLFGTSWRTSLFGYLTGLVLTAQAMMEAGTVWPADWPGRLKIMAGLLLAAWGRFQKDNNVSNAPAPVDARPIPPMVNP